MKFGNASWGFRETPLEEQLKITKGLGLEVLELGIANAPKDLPLDTTDAELDNVKKVGFRAHFPLFDVYYKQEYRVCDNIF